LGPETSALEENNRELDFVGGYKPVTRPGFFLQTTPTTPKVKFAKERATTISKTPNSN